MYNFNAVAFCILVFFEPQARIWYDRLVTADYALPQTPILFLSFL